MPYDVLVVDPPWPIAKLTRKTRPKQVDMDYTVVDLDRIRQFDVGQLASDSSWMFLWTIQKYLFESRAILEDWGFHYLLMMVWKKEYGRSSGMPLKGFRWNAEFIAVGHRGKADLWPSRPLIPAVFSAVNEGHSIKPQAFYDLIAPLGDRRIDLFARKPREGWDVWGNEVESDIEIEF